MKNRILITFVFLASVLTANGQVGKFSLDVNLPVTAGSNFIADDFNGVVDVGFKYRFVNNPLIKIGSSLNGGVLTSDFKSGSNLEKVNIYNIQPRIFAELVIKPIKLRPFIGVGYSFLLFNKTNDGTAFENSPTKESFQEGYNFNLGVAYDFLKFMYIQAQFDFTRLSLPKNIDDVSYNKDIHIIKLGLGFRL